MKKLILFLTLGLVFLGCSSNEEDVVNEPSNNNGKLSIYDKTTDTEINNGDIVLFHASGADEKFYLKFKNTKSSTVKLNFKITASSSGDLSNIANFCVSPDGNGYDGNCIPGASINLDRFIIDGAYLTLNSGQIISDGGTYLQHNPSATTQIDYTVEVSEFNTNLELNGTTTFTVRYVP